MNQAPIRELLRQHLKDNWKAYRHKHLRPALWETRRWLEMTRDK